MGTSEVCVSLGSSGMDISSQSSEAHSVADVVEPGAQTAGSPGVLAAARRAIPPKLYRIGEVVDYSGMSRQTIHNYTTMGLLRESRWTRGGHRLYDESVFDRLDRIVRMRAANKSLEDIRDYFAGADGEAVGSPGAVSAG